MPKTNPNSADITFAFSERQDSWTTRYSFVPTCYANCDDQMMSFKDGVGKAWLHDKTQSRNSFHGAPLAPSFLEVSFNDSPSEVKVFNSISLETNRDVWATSFSSNVEHDDENSQNTLTEVMLDQISDKEGFKYFELPKSVSNSTANIVPAPALLSSVEGSTGQEQTEVAVSEAQQLYQDNLEQNIYEAISITVPLDEVSSSSFLSTPYGNNVQILGYFQGNPSFPIPTGVYNFQEMFTNLNNSGYYVFSGGQIPLGAAPTISNIQNGLITISLSVPVLLNDSPQEDVDLFFSALQDFLINSSAIFAMTPAEINGDQMRGPYLNAKLECFTADPLELHSVNVDYAFSSSAARLTQNS